MPRLTAPTLAVICALITPVAVADDGLRLPKDLDKTLRQLLDDLKPALDEMFRLMENFEGVDDPRHYQLPEVLPNGDIIIRRRPDAPPFKAPQRKEDPEDDEGTKT